MASSPHEPAISLRDDDDSDGWYWGDVRDALIATWPECNMNNGATDCTLGPPQTQYAGLSCSGTLSAKVTFYGYPDNDSGSGTSTGTNVIAHTLNWQGWVDLWMESNATNSEEAVLQCEDAWTADVTEPKDVWRNPSSALQVDVAAFFNVAANQCNSVTWYSL